MGRGRESRTERSPGRWEHFVTACCPRGGRWELRATVKQNTTPDGRDSSSLLRSGTSLAAVPDAVPVRVVSYRAVPCRTVVPPSPYSSSPPPPPSPSPLCQVHATPGQSAHRLERQERPQCSRVAVAASTRRKLCVAERSPRQPLSRCPHPGPVRRLSLALSCPTSSCCWGRSALARASVGPAEPPGAGPCR